MRLNCMWNLKLTYFNTVLTRNCKYCRVMQ